MAGNRSALSVFPVLVLSALGGCVDNVSVVQRLDGTAWDMATAGAPPAGADPFIEGLHTGYVDLAEAEFAEYDWEDGAYFLANARAIADGGIPRRLDPGERGLTEIRFTDGAIRVDEVIGWPGARLRAPSDLADTQVYYDCWVQEAQEGHQEDEITACRAQYETALALVHELAELPENLAVVLPEEGGVTGGIVLEQADRQVVLDRAFAGGGTDDGLRALPTEEGEIGQAFAGALAARPADPEHFGIDGFAFGSSRPRGTEAVLAAVVAAVDARPAAEIEIVGHTDAVGSRAGNLAVSRARARAVARQLRVVLGQRDRVRLIIRGKGESTLLEDVPGRSEANRRVEITVR